MFRVDFGESLPVTFAVWGDDDGSQFTPYVSKIVFGRSNEAATAFDANVMNVDGSNQTPLTASGGGVTYQNLPIAPDGSTALLLQRGATASEYEIAKTALSGGPVINLTNNSALNIGGYWSPYGSRIGDGKADVAVYREGTWWIYQNTLGVTGVHWGIAPDVPIPRR